MTANATGSISTIVVATDFSETADLALKRAADIAKARAARVVIVHVTAFEYRPVTGPEPWAIPPDYQNELRERVMERLGKAADELQARGLKVETELVDGIAAHEIVEAAARHAGDLIVIGTRGHTGLEHLLLGSVAESVVREAECPVLTIHPGDEAPLEHHDTILLPTDYSDDANAVLALAGTLFANGAADRGPTKLLLLHAYPTQSMVAPISVYMPEPPFPTGNPRTMAEEALAEKADGLRKLGFEVEVIGVLGDPSTEILALARARKVDLIAMGTRGLSRFKQLLLGSTARRVVQRAHCPVLTMRPKG